MSKKQESPKASEVIEQFLNFCRTSENEYRLACETVKECDDRSNDFRHALELDSPKSSERSKMATREMHNLQRRRKAKNTIEVLEGIHNLTRSKEGEKFINQLREVLGQSRKIEKLQATRVYKKRIQDESK